MDGFWRCRCTGGSGGGRNVGQSHTAPSWGLVCSQSSSWERCHFHFQGPDYNPRAPTYLPSDPSEVALPLCAPMSSSIKWAQIPRLPPRSWRV